jgi:hypothetical protein
MWLERTNDSPNSRITRTVFITGGSGDILLDLLGVNREKIIDVLKNDDLAKAPFKLDFQKCLVHKGMASVIIHGSESHHSSSLWPVSNASAKLSDFALSFLDKRVANKYKGGYQLGTVTRVTQEDLTYIFHITYDSGNKERVELTTLRGLLENHQYVEACRMKPQKRKRHDLGSESTEGGGQAQENLHITQEKRIQPNEKAKENSEMKPGEINQLVLEVTEKKSKNHEIDMSPATKNKKIHEEARPKDLSENNTSQMDTRGAKKLLLRPRDVINLRVMKYFVDEESKSGGLLPFFGTIDDYEFVEEAKEFLWHIIYDDGDMEHCGHEELYIILKQYKKNREMDPQLYT